MTQSICTFTTCNYYVDDYDSTKVIVDIAKLKALVSPICKQCGNQVAISHTFKGCCVQLDIMCNNGHHYVWMSSEIHYNKNEVPISKNDLLMGASILFSGIHFSSVKKMCDILHLRCIHEKTFYRYQRIYYAPVVTSFWEKHQTDTIQK